MLSEERIKLMTKMAAYEANEGKKNVAVSSYFCVSTCKTHTGNDYYGYDSCIVSEFF